MTNVNIFTKKKILTDLKFTSFILKLVIRLQSTHSRDKNDYFHSNNIKQI